MLTSTPSTGSRSRDDLEILRLRRRRIISSRAGLVRLYLAGPGGKQGDHRPVRPARCAHRRRRGRERHRTGESGPRRDAALQQRMRIDAKSIAGESSTLASLGERFTSWSGRKGWAPPERARVELRCDQWRRGVTPPITSSDIFRLSFLGSDRPVRVRNDARPSCARPGMTSQAPEK